jgi:hypothetical protein
MSKEHNYKGFTIKNYPYKSEPRWFISNEDGSKNEKFKSPQATLKEAKETIDNTCKDREELLMEDLKDFYVNISFSGRLGISVSAENKDEVLKKIYQALGTMTIESKDKNVLVDEIEWDLIDREQQGNIGVPFVRDVEITED